MIDDETAVELLEQMLRIPSLCGQEDEVGAFLLDFMQEHGFRSDRDEVGNAIGQTGNLESDRTLMIVGHMDTAPGQIPVGCSDGKLVGRGAVDAKGPLATAIVAAEHAAAGGAQVRITVVGAVQEEGPSIGARHLARDPAPDFLVIAEPGGSDAIVLGYKGSQRFTVSLRVPSSHTAGPDLGPSEQLIKFWNRLVLRCAEISRDAETEFDRLTPRLLGMSSTTDGLYDQAELEIGLRLPPAADLPVVSAMVKDLLPEADYGFGEGEAAVRCEKSNRLVSAFVRSIRAEGGEPRFKVKTGTSDMNVLVPVWQCPAVAYGPGDSRLDHTPHEHVSVDEYLRGVKVLTRVLTEL